MHPEIWHCTKYVDSKSALEVAKTIFCFAVLFNNAKSK